MIWAHSREKGFRESRLTVWTKIKKRTGKKIDAIDNKPACPHGLLYLWDIYNSLIKGCDRIGYTEIDCYARLHGIKFEVWETGLLIDVEMMRRKQ